MKTKAVRTSGPRSSFWKRNRNPILFLTPFMLLFAVFTVIPVLSSMGLSMTYFNVLEAPRFVFWENYRRLLLNDEVFLIAVQNTFLFAFLTGPVSYVACLLLAWLINDLKRGLRAFLTIVFYAPSISGAVYMIWAVMFSSDSYGYVNSLFMRLGILRDPVAWLEDPRYMLGVIILVSIWLSLGTSFLSFIAGLKGMDAEQFEAGAIDGIRNRWQELWYITLPNIRPQLMFGAVIQITAALAVADVSVNLAGFPSVDYGAHTIVTHIMDYGILRFDMGYASSIATVLFLTMVGLNKLVQRLLSRVGA